MNTASLTVANTILKQLGGNRFRAMTGARDLLGGPDSLQFKIRGSARGINAVRIVLDPSDTYTVTFYKITRGARAGSATVAEFEGVYADGLAALFTATTGLCTSL